MSRRKWTAEEKMSIVLKGLTPGAVIAEICRKHKIAQTQYYSWREAFIAGGKAGLTSGGARTREKELEEQLRDAQAKIGEQTLHKPTGICGQRFGLCAKGSPPTGTGESPLYCDGSRHGNK